MFIKHNQEFLLAWIQPPTAFLNYRFRTRKWCILRIVQSDRDPTFWFFSHHQKTDSRIESRSNSTWTSHTRSGLESLSFFFQEAAVTSRIWTIFHYFYSWRYWFDDHTWIEVILVMHCVNEWDILFWNGQIRTLKTIKKSILVESKMSKVSSIVGARPGRAYRLESTLLTFHVLQLDNPAISRSTTELP
jgi:hypothetical protein